MLWIYCLVKYHSFYAFGNKKQNFVFVLLFHSFALTLQRVAAYVNKSHLYYK